MKTEQAPHANADIPVRKPDVSFVMTAYNASVYLRASLPAALNQDFGNYEVVLVDDGSSDDTEKFCRSIPDVRLRYIRKDHIGRAKALNAAVNAARGEYIAINDADDLSKPNRLSYTISFMQSNPGLAVAATAYQTIHEHSTMLGKMHVPTENKDGPPQPKFYTALRLYRSNPFVHSTVVFKKAIWEQIDGYDESLSICIDYDFYLRAIAVGKIIRLPGETVLYYRNSTSSFKSKSRLDYLKTLHLIKERARKALSLPLFTRLFDIIYLYQVLHW